MDFPTPKTVYTGATKQTQPVSTLLHGPFNGTKLDFFILKRAESVKISISIVIALGRHYNVPFSAIVTIFFKPNSLASERIIPREKWKRKKQWKQGSLALSSIIIGRHATRALTNEGGWGWGRRMAKKGSFTFLVIMERARAPSVYLPAVSLYFLLHFPLFRFSKLRYTGFNNERKRAYKL